MQDQTVTDQGLGRVAEAVSPPTTPPSPPCVCRHSFGAHRPDKGCSFCYCRQFRVETLASVDLKESDEPALELVGKHPAFSQVPREHVIELMRVGRRLEFYRGDVLLREGEYSDCIYLLVQGTVSVDRTVGHLANLGAGEFIGEMGTLRGRRRSATVTARDDVEALEVSMDDLREVFRSYTDLVVAFARLIRARTPAANV
jgi:CRP/FNR family cyclic AMP-dependent transcriptional regulator